MNRTHWRVHLLVVALVTAAVLGCWLAGVIEFFRPWWLLALLGLPYFGWLARRGLAGLPSRPNAIATTGRCLLYLLVVAALADVQYVLRSNTLAVYFLLDYSASVPEAVREQALAYATGAARTKPRKDLAGVVVFGEEPSIEYLPGKSLDIDALHSVVNPSYTNLQAAIELAAAAFPPNCRKKIVLISDGNQNAGDAVAAARYAAAEHVELEVLPVFYAVGNEVLVEKLQLPERVRENEPFELTVHVSSLQPAPGTLTILCNGEVVAQQDVQLKAGRSHYGIALQLKEPGFFVYTARLTSPRDTIAENNELSNYVYIQGDSRFLFVVPDGGAAEVEALVQVCGQERLEHDVIPVERFPTGLEQLQRYDTIVLANVPAGKFSEDQQQMIRTAVKDLGIGLLMLGGENSFGAGGYEETPIEEALPVSMDIRQKKIIPKGALAIVLHTCEFADGNYWAKQITKAAIKTIQPQDEVGVLHFGAKGDEWVFPLRPAADKNWMFNKVDKCEPADMPSFAPAFKLAKDALLQSDAMVRHIIVISDGDPARPTPEDLDALAAASVTVSTVAINPHSPRDVDVMKFIAYKTQGRYYLVKDPKTLPAIFIKEAQVVKRSLIFNHLFQPLLAMSSELTKGIGQNEIPPLQAYVATTAKYRALVSLTSDNENKDPVLAEWHFGLGKAVAFTSDASANWGKQWVGWDKYRKVWAQVFRWTSRLREKSNLTVRTHRDGDRVILTLDAVDERGNFVNFTQLDARRVDSRNQGHELDVHQVGAGRYQAEFRARDTGVNLVNLSYTNPADGSRGFTRAGVALPYSAEFLQLEANLALLRRLAQLGSPRGALLNADPAKARVFESQLPPSIALQPVWEYLLLIALVLFLADVVIRRVVLTREDLAGAWAAVMARLRRQPGGDRDQTMTALLRRKGKVFGKPAPTAAGDPPAARPPPDFKAQLDRQAQQRPVAPLPTETPLTAARPAPPGGDPRPATTTTPAPDQEQSYTDRLLSAKRRAQKKRDDDPDAPA